jgi:hypothetical protein
MLPQHKIYRRRRELNPYLAIDPKILALDGVSRTEKSRFTVLSLTPWCAFEPLQRPLDAEA